MPSDNLLRNIFSLGCEYRDLRIIDKRFVSLLFALYRKNQEKELFCFAREKSDSYSFNVCDGKEALFRSLKSFAPIKKPPIDSMYDIDAVSLSFAKLSSYPNEDKKRLKKLGVKYNPKHPLPYIRAFSPGLQPWLPDENQAKKLHDGLEMTIKLLKSDLVNPEIIATGQIPYIEIDPDSLEMLNVKYKNLTLTSPAYTVITPEDDDSVKKIKQGCKRRGRFATGVYRSPLPISFDEENRAVFPHIYFIADMKTGLLLGSDIFENIAVDGYKIVDKIVEIICNQKEIPRTITVRNDETYHLIKDTCDLFGIKIRQQNAVDLLDNYWHSLFKELST